MHRMLYFCLVSMFILTFGCKDTAPDKGKQGEKASSSPVVKFDPTKINPNISGGHVDVIEPAKPKVSGTIHTGGWASDSANKVPSLMVFIVADGKHLPVTPMMGLDREDVAKALREEKMKKSGWDITFNANLIGAGKHRLEFYAVQNDGTFAPLLYNEMKSFEIEIVP